jgi:hypothetical protein
MSEQGNQEFGFVEDGRRSRAATALFVVGLAVIGANSVLYFFGVESFSHPAISVLGLALLVPLYLKER